MSHKPLKEKLQSLQCHFTWNFEIKDQVEENHILQVLALRLKHTPYPNHSTFLAMKAYVLHRQGRSPEALRSLRDAEDLLRQEHPSTASRQALVLYGNYAWIYYHLTNYKAVEGYLGRIRAICRSLGSPKPYSVSIPEVYAQKGWSLLMGGFRNGEEAEKCFRMALRGDESNEELQAGLAIAAFACWTHNWEDELMGKAKELLEKVVLRQPQNYELKVYLAKALHSTDSRRISHLLNDVAQNSLNPEVLRNAAKVWKRWSLAQAVSILKQAIALDSSYHLLYYDLGVCYREQMERGLQGEDDVWEAAIECFLRALEEDPFSIYPRLELAKLHSKSFPDYEEEIYQNLLEELPGASKRCQQAIYLHWGDFLLHKKGLKQEALKMYEACYNVAGEHPLEQKRLAQRLRSLAKQFRTDSERDDAETVNRLLEALGSPGAGDRKTGSAQHRSGQA